MLWFVYLCNSRPARNFHLCCFIVCHVFVLFHCTSCICAVYCISRNLCCSIIVIMIQTCICAASSVCILMVCFCLFYKMSNVQVSYFPNFMIFYCCALYCYCWSAFGCCSFEQCTDSFNLKIIIVFNIYFIYSNDFVEVFNSPINGVISGHCVLYYVVKFLSI